MALKDATADVVVRVRRTVVVDVERTVILVLVIVTAMVQARVTTVIVPVIRDIVCCTVDPICLLFMKISVKCKGKGLRPPHPCTPTPTGDITPPLAGVPGGDSRCCRSRSTYCGSRRRTDRDTGSGYSHRHGAGTGYYRYSSSYPGHKS